MKVDELLHVWATFYSLLIPSQVPNLYVNNFFWGGIYMPKEGRKGRRMQKRKGRREVSVIILFS